MNFGYPDGLLAGIDAGDRRAESRHRFAQKSAAAADVEKLEVLKGLGGKRVATEMVCYAVPDIGDSHRVEPVQRTELAVGIPPGVGHGGKTCDFIGRCCSGRFRRGCGIGGDHVDGVSVHGRGELASNTGCEYVVRARPTATGSARASANYR